MKTHTNKFKKNISKMGRILDSKITYTLNGETIELSKDQLNSITPSFESSLLKATMKVLTIDSNIEIPENTILNYKFGVKVDDDFEYLDYGNYIVYKIEKQEDTNSYLMTCYDKMLYAMKDYEAPNITYPITVRSYINSICNKIGLTFKNANDTFANYDKEIPNELYSDIGYTYRDVLDELAQVTASTICINENDELEIRYINDTQSDNFYNYKDIKSMTNGWTIDKDGWVNLYYDNSDSSSGKYANYFTNLMQLTPNKEYTVVIEIEKFENLSLTLNQARTDEQFVSIGSIVRNTQPGTYIRLATTKSSYDNVTVGLRMFANIASNSIAQARIRISVIEDTNINKDNFSYEMFDGDTIDEDYLKNVNVTFGEKFGPVNSIVLSRAGESDNIYLRDEESVTENGLCEIKIVENQIMNFNNRNEFLQEIFNQLNGLEYYINDFSSTGVCYYDICDKYYVKVADKFYKCIMFNDEINITQGLEENIYTEMPEDSETDYKKADKTDRRINQAYIIVDKQNQTIESLTSRVNTIDTTTNNNYQELLTKFNDYTPQSQTLEIENSVLQLQTDTYTKTEINTKLTDGSVTKVLTTAGTFDENGLTIEKTNAKSKGRFNEKGVTVLDATGSTDTELLFAGYDENLNESIVRTKNLNVTKYLTIGAKSRIEDYEDGTGIFVL